MSNGECAVGAANKAKIEGLEDGMAAFRKEFGDLRKTIEMALRRPGWMTTVIITVLSSTCVGLIVALVGVLKNSGGVG